MSTIGGVVNSDGYLGGITQAPVVTTSATSAQTAAAQAARFAAQGGVVQKNWFALMIFVGVILFFYFYARG